MRPHSAISYADAAAIIADYTGRLQVNRASESVPLLGALGRILARPVLADRAQPPFPRSTRDGFACRADDLAGDAWLKVIGLIKAGEAWAGNHLEAGEAIEIMTGAPLPGGADSVVMAEHVQRSTASTGEQIRLLTGRSLQPGDNFVPAGAEARTGATLIAKGTRIAAAQIAAAASVGAIALHVHERARVAILSTGDELVPLDQEPLPFQIRNSNSYSLAALVLALGARPVIQPIARDTPAALEAAIRAALIADATERPDLLLLSGGVSMGKYDLVEDVLAGFNASFFFTGVQMQPGKPVVFGEVPLGGDAGSICPFFGLPGNPVSTLVTFALFAAPVIAALAGERGYVPHFAEARLAEAVPQKSKLRRFLPARLRASSDSAIVSQVSWQSSGDVAGTAQANCFLVVPEAGESGELARGASARVLLL